MKAILTVLPFPEGTIPTLAGGDGVHYGVIDWIEDHLLQPDGDHAGEPFVLSWEQANFLKWYYAVDRNGRFVFRRAVLRRAKGWGKSPFLAALCLAELCGPVRFSHWDGDAPVGKRVTLPWVVIAGVSETQTENTLAAVRAMAQDSDLADDPELGLDIGQTRIFIRGGGKIVPITASSSTQEGARPTFAVMDETHHWTKGNGGQALAKVIRRNLAKSRDGAARVVETTNAHEPGADSVAEDSYRAHQAQAEGRTRKNEILYDSREAPALSTEQLADEALLREALRCTYGNADWINLDSLVGEIYDPTTSVEESRRFYLNQIVAAADAWLKPHLYVEDAALKLEPKDTISLGFDGSLTDDSTALVACRISDGAVFLLGLWEKPDGPEGEGWEVNKTDVRGFVENAFAVYDVVAFFADVAYWETDVDSWRDEYAEQLLVKATTRHSVAWDMRGHQSETVYAVETLHRAFTDGELKISADPRLKRHFLNARRRPNKYGVSFGKETRESPKKVDAVAATVLARMARSRVIADNVLSKRRGRVGTIVGWQ